MSSRSSRAEICVIYLSEPVSAERVFAFHLLLRGLLLAFSGESLSEQNNTHLQPSLSPRSPQCCAARTNQWMSTLVSVPLCVYNTHPKQISNKLALSKYATPVLHTVLLHTSPAKSKVVSACSRSAHYSSLNTPHSPKIFMEQLVFSMSVGT